MIAQSQEYKCRWYQTHEAATARRRLTSCRAAAMAVFEAFCPRHKSLARLEESQDHPSTRILDTYFARNMNTTDNAALFSERVLRLGLGGAAGYPILAIEVKIRCSLSQSRKSVTRPWIAPDRIHLFSNLVKSTSKYCFW